MVAQDCNGYTQECRRLQRKVCVVSQLPLHPAIVHLPIGLALLAPVLAIVLTSRLWHGGQSRLAWLMLPITQAMLVAGGVLALLSGEHEEERVEHVVGKAFIEQHETAAQIFLAVAVAALGISLVVTLLRAASSQRLAMVLATVASLVVAGLGLNVGRAGGELVYHRGAAAAYANDGRAKGVAATTTETRPEEQHDDDDDD